MLVGSPLSHCNRFSVACNSGCRHLSLLYAHFDTSASSRSAAQPSQMYCRQYGLWSDTRWLAPRRVSPARPVTRSRGSSSRTLRPHASQSASGPCSDQAHHRPVLLLWKGSPHAVFIISSARRNGFSVVCVASSSTVVWRTCPSSQIESRRYPTPSGRTAPPCSG